MASSELNARARAFSSACRAPSGVRLSAIHHPDLDELWLHYVAPERRLCVSFADGDERAYAVIRTPERGRIVAYRPIDDIMEAARGELASWPSPTKGTSP